MKILGIGNSFSEDTLTYVPFILREMGVKNVEVANFCYPGCSIDQHVQFITENSPSYMFCKNYTDKWEVVNDAKFLDHVGEKKWDVILTQQASWLGGEEGSYGNLDKLVELIKKHSFAPLTWNMTWAYQQNTKHPAFPNYKSSQKYMYSKLLKTTKKKILHDKDFSKIVPNGTAIQNARTSYVGDNLTRDGFHLSFDLGRLIASLTFIKSVLGLDISKVKYIPENSDESKLKVAIESAENAVKNPFKVTKSKYIEK